uniref:Protein kinase domain-containing protein n=1 Tax=Megaselia scalaris TaxID=36166 RepID=T1GKX4_MEGSC
MYSSNPNDYELRVELANCCSDIATVYLSQYLPTEEHVAVKKYRLDSASNTLFNQIQHEIITMRQLNHPNILSFHIAYVNYMEMYLISPFMCYCSCSDTMKNIFDRAFGATQTNTAFGGFGSAPASTAAPAFGGFGATATTTAAPTFGGFGAATATSSSTGFGGFGSTFGSTFGKPAATAAPSFGGFGSFGSTLGQPRKHNHQLLEISPDEAFAQSIFNVSIFNDERDATIAKWNFLQASWGTGKSFYSQAAVPVEITPDNYLCRFKSMGYSRLPGKDNKLGLVALKINKPQSEVEAQKQQIITTLGSIFGSKPNLQVNIDSIKSLEDKKTQIVIYIEEKSLQIPNDIKRFNELKWRIKCQEQETEAHSLYLRKLEKDLVQMKQKHVATTAKIMERKRKLAELTHNILKVCDF